MDQATQSGAIRHSGGPGSGPPDLRARVAGAVVCALLLAVEAAWIVEDLRGAGLHDTASGWFGTVEPGRAQRYLSTGAGDLVLVAVLAVALTRARRRFPAGAYAAAGLLAVQHRLPGLWEFTAGWSADTPLRGRALATSIAFVAGGLALIALGLLGGRRLSDANAAAGAAGAGGATDAYGTAVIGESGKAAGPVRPHPAAAVAGGLLLLALALESAGWQAYFIQKYNDPGYPPHMYRQLVTGESPLPTLLAMPVGYAGWAAAVLCAGAAAAAFARLPSARPLGMALGFAAALNAVVALDTWTAEKAMFKTAVLPDYVIAEQSFAVFELAAGLLLIALFALRARPPAGGPPPGA